VLPKNLVFDPSQPEQWKEVTLDTIRDRGGGSVLAILNFRLKNELRRTYNMQVVHRKAAGFWKDLKNLRWYLEDTAKQMRINPLKPEEWYLVNSADIVSRSAALLQHFVSSCTSNLLL
jgi:hypothetical protein